MGFLAEVCTVRVLNLYLRETVNSSQLNLLIMLCFVAVREMIYLDYEADVSQAGVDRARVYAPVHL